MCTQAVTASSLKTNRSELLGRVRHGHEKLEEALDSLDALDAIDEAEPEGTISLAELRESPGR